MKTKVSIVALLSFFLLASCEDEKLQVGEYGSLNGVILDGTNYEPLSGVLLVSNPSSTSTLTDDQGMFSIPKVDIGEVAITARKNEYLTNSVSVAVYANETTDLTFFLLKDENNVGSVVIYDPVPGNGAVNQLESFTFNWSVDQEDNSKELHYSVFIFESNSTIQKIVGENLSITEVTVNNLDPDTTYYWYVVAKYEGSTVANSPTWTFKTAPEE